MPIRKPRWSVTWPTRPNGVYTRLVRAADPVDAVRVAAELEWPTTDGYTLAFDYEPEVWRLLRPYRMRSHQVAGPEFSDETPGEVAFTPEPLDLREIANRAMGVVKVGDALGHSEAEIQAAVGQLLSALAPAHVAEVLAMVVAEIEQVNAFTGGWA